MEFSSKGFILYTFSLSLITFIFLHFVLYLCFDPGPHVFLLKIQYVFGGPKKLCLYAMVLCGVKNELFVFHKQLIFYLDLVRTDHRV